MKLRFQKAFLVFRKDWREVRRNWQVVLPIVVIPIIFSVVLPVLIMIIPNMVATPGPSLGSLGMMIENMPRNIQDELAGMTDQQAMQYIFGLYFFAPFFLIIPLMAASVISADSFAGEKERKTIEALLATPISDSELIFGKLMGSFIPSMIVTIVSFLTYSLVIDIFSYSMFDGKILLPNMIWIMLIFGLAPTMALAGIGLTVIISARVKGFREAQQISAMLVIPILALVFGQATGAIILGPVVIAVLITVFLVVDFAVFRIGVTLFRREEILSKLS